MPRRPPQGALARAAGPPRGAAPSWRAAAAGATPGRAPGTTWCGAGASPGAGPATSGPPGPPAHPSRAALVPAALWGDGRGASRQVSCPPHRKFGHAWRSPRQPEPPGSRPGAAAAAPGSPLADGGCGGHPLLFLWLSPLRSLSSDARVQNSANGELAAHPSHPPLLRPGSGMACSGCRAPPWEREASERPSGRADSAFRARLGPRRLARVLPPRAAVGERPQGWYPAGAAAVASSALFQDVCNPGHLVNRPHAYLPVAAVLCRDAMGAGQAGASLNATLHVDVRLTSWLCCSIDSCPAVELGRSCFICCCYSFEEPSAAPGKQPDRHVSWRRCSP